MQPAWRLVGSGYAPATSGPERSSHEEFRQAEGQRCTDHIACIRRSDRLHELRQNRMHLFFWSQASTQGKELNLKSSLTGQDTIDSSRERKNDTRSHVVAVGRTPLDASRQAGSRCAGQARVFTRSGATSQGSRGDMTMRAFKTRKRNFPGRVRHAGPEVPQ